MAPPAGSGPVQYAEGATIDPKMPFVEKVEPLLYGDLVILRGRLASNCRRFDINFKWDTSVVFHLSARFPQTMKVVVLNTHHDGKWGKEVRLSGTCGLHPGDPFSATILVQTKHYKIALNGRHIATYEHILPHELVSLITVEGDATLHSFQVNRMSNRLYLERPRHETGRARCMPELPWHWDQDKRNDPKLEKPPALPGGYNLAIPYSVLVPGGIKAGRLLYMTFIPGGLSKGFQFVIKGAQSDQADTMMKMDVNFEQHQVTFSCSCKSSAKDMVAPTFPFRKLCHADVLMRCAPNAMQISVNNVHFFQYPHQVKNPADFQALEITGETTLLHMRLQ